ncbi:pirin family protein [Candidatus Raskinella chloraquaticus]|uniref:Quercetin 2,3-dioxygenase n=1 Tax=Candidatus Raskinella chloraquaticus TaxID=1951219 RepID=A0A1W9HR13_9HYPH|nr:MAG: quercetin 2,3-dioxygenase [Proteobacteria bacterium SG_bin8]
MAMKIRKAKERGRVDFGWLDSRHTFSFGNYHDVDHMGFGPLRVINEDQVAPGGGFQTHPHRDMEIISYVLEGGLAHKDSLGTGALIRPGDVQLMSAGTGIRHSEYNASSSEPVHFLQIWVLPETNGLQPGYAQKSFLEEERRGRLRLVASRQGRAASLVIHQDVDLYASLLPAGASLSHRFAANRIGWVQVARGSIAVDGVQLEAGDGASLTAMSDISLQAHADAEFLLFDMAP